MQVNGCFSDDIHASRRKGGAQKAEMASRKSRRPDLYENSKIFVYDGHLNAGNVWLEVKVSYSCPDHVEIGWEGRRR